MSQEQKINFPTRRMDIYVHAGAAAIGGLATGFLTLLLTGDTNAATVAAGTVTVTTGTAGPMIQNRLMRRMKERIDSIVK